MLTSSDRLGRKRPSMKPEVKRTTLEIVTPPTYSVYQMDMSQWTVPNKHWYDDTAVLTNL